MKKYLSLVKFSHTIFALPFALLGFFLAVVRYEVDNIWLLLAQVVLCMVFARSAAMGFNRYIDRNIDAANPRTRNREIPAGIISPRRALFFVVINSLLFMLVAFTINWLCFLLSPVALLVVLGYSFTKRFTFLCHLILGLGLALAPVGAYLAVAGQFELLPVLYGLVVLTWVSGFDILYALQDVDFDKEQDLWSIPVVLGKRNALWVSGILHLFTAVILVIAGFLSGTTYEVLYALHWIGGLLFIGLLVYQHVIVGPGRLDRINLAFFTANGIGSLIFATLFIADLLI